MLNTIVQKKLNGSPEFSALHGEMTAALSEMERRLREMTRSGVSALEQNVARMVTSGGKRLRPILAYLSWRCAGREEHEIIPLMVMLELMHTASLIHDDVVDRSDERRGVITIHRLLGEHGAVQCGDFLLGRAMELLHLYRGTGVNETLSETSVEMCLGELMQLNAAFSLEGQSEERYYLQIKRKTAYLLSASCFTGALAGGMTAEEAAPLRNYGLELGIAFQLKDDLLDFAAPKCFGKPRGQDLRKGIYTLPVRYAVERRPDREMRALLENPEKSEADVSRLISYITDSGALDYTQRVLEESSRRAVEALAHMEEGPGKMALAELALALAGRRA